MLTRNFGIEIELTGVTRHKAAKVVAEHLEGRILKEGSNYKVTAPDGRVWEIVYDGSIKTQRKLNGQKVPAGDAYSVELVSPILTYGEDIESIQEMVRKIRKAGGFSEK